MNEEPIVCLCVAIYNTEKYLEKCLQSIRNQTYRSIKVICVDDCSTDNSLSIVNRYVQEDKRFVLVHNEKNCGLSISRNVAIDYCKKNVPNAAYITFIDSDDSLNESAIEMLLNIAHKNTSDIVLAELTYVDGSETVLPSNNDCYHILDNDKDSIMRKILADKIGSQVGGKFFSFNCVRNIKFPDARYYAQDMMVMHLFCNNAKSICLTDLQCYYYLGSRTDNTTNLPKNYIKGSFDRAIAFYKRYEFCETYYSELRENMLSRAVDFSGGALRRVKKNTFGKEDAECVKQYIKKYKSDILHCKSISIYKRIAVVLLAKIK